MSTPDRSDCVRIMDNPEDRLLLSRGAGFESVQVPVGSRVLYPPPPLESIADLPGAIRNALDSPLGCDPLSAMLKPGMKVTIAFDDVSLPLPPMRAPDVRQLIIEAVLERLAAAGVTDIELIAALALHRRMTPAELKHAVGPKVFAAHFTQGTLYNHDAEDPEGMVKLGETKHGEQAWINRRAVESDLLIYANINLVSMDGGNKSVSVGLTNYAGLRHHHSVHGMMNSRPYMDPRHSELHHSADRIGEIVQEHVNIFTVETTLDSRMFGWPLGFISQREDRWSKSDKLLATSTRLALDALPEAVTSRIFHAIRSPYGVTGVNAGRTNPVHERTLERVLEQQLVPVQGQSDVVIAGLPFLGPYNVNSVMNPILVHCLGMGYVFSLHRNQPLVKKNGVMIFMHPLEERFHPVHHPSYIQFYNEVLEETRDPKVMEQRFEEEYARDPRYVDLYRHSYAFHGVHPFYMWYWACYGQSHVGKIIYVAPKSERAARRIGGEVAKSLPEALEMASDHVGSPEPSVSVYHFPPIFLLDVL